MNEMRKKLRRYLTIAFAHRWHILVPAALCFTAAVGWAITRDDVYEAQALLMGHTARTANVERLVSALKSKL